MLEKSAKLSTQLHNTSSDINKLTKRITSLEQEYQSLTDTLTNEIDFRKNMEKHTISNQDATTSKVKTLKESIDKLTQVLNSSLQEFKGELTKEITSKQKTLNDQVDTKIKRLDFYDQQTASNNYHFDSSITETNAKLGQLELFITTQLRTYKEDLNTNLVHIEFMEKKLNDNYTIIKTDIANISKEIIEMRNDIVSLRNFKDNFEGTSQAIGNDLLKQEDIVNKFTSRVNVITNEIQMKMGTFESLFAAQNDGYKVMKEEMYQHLNKFDESITGGIKGIEKDMMKQKEEVAKEIEAFELHMMGEQEKFTMFIQDNFEEYRGNVKKMIDYSGEDIEKIKHGENSLNEDMVKMKREFFENLNELEEFMTKKYESLFRMISRDRACNHNTIQ